MKRFYIVMITAYIVMWLYSWTSLISPLLLQSPWYQGILAFWICAWILQIIRLYNSEKHKIQEVVHIVSYVLMNYFFFLFIFSFIKDLVVALLMVVYDGDVSFINYYANLFILAVGVLLTAVGYYNAQFGLVLKRHSFKLREGQKGKLNIAHISDLHIGPVIKTHYVERVVEMVNSTNADIVVLTGDIIDAPMSLISKDMEPLKNLKSRYGVYFVSGNHEYFWNFQESIKRLQDLGVKILRNDGHMIMHDESEVWLGGVGDISQDRESDPRKAVAPGKVDLSVLLAHQPKSALQANNLGFDLFLCGHTHWGQFFPITLIVHLFNPFSRGHYEHEDMKVYVHPGTGFWGSPLRVGTHCEVALHEVRY